VRLLAAITAILGVLLLTSSASAWAINGCVESKNGALRIVVDPTACTFQRGSDFPAGFHLTAERPIGPGKNPLEFPISHLIGSRF
jgi:hypothetical protein